MKRKKEEASTAREQVVTLKETARQQEETLKAAATKIGVTDYHS